MPDGNEFDWWVEVLTWSGEWIRYGQGRDKFTDYKVRGTRQTWIVSYPFGNPDDARDALRAWADKHGIARKYCRVRCESTGETLNLAGFSPTLSEVFETKKAEISKALHTSTAGGTPVSYEEKKPLHVPRETLIKRLQERAAEERKRREDAEAEVAATRQKLTDAVKAFTDDELTNIVAQHVTSDVTWLKEAKEKKSYVSKDSKPYAIETTLEKQIRVMEMASDKEIEVTPDEEIYQLL